MKTSKEIVKKTKNQLGKQLFTYIVVILFVLLVVFSIFKNLNMFSISGQKKLREEEVKKEMLLEAIDDSRTMMVERDITQTSGVYVWGDKTEAISIAKTQLSNMKVSFYLLISDV